jgi:SAM-dependent methyltransferase
MLIKVDCPHCHGGQTSVWATENGYALNRCSECSILFVSPRPSEETISEANKMGVHRGEEGRLDVRARREPGKVDHYSAILREMFADEIAAGKPFRWLDVGAGYGEFIEAVLKTMPSGSEAVGIEPMLYKVDTAAKLGLPVHQANLSDLTGSFDAISLINVYSHVPDFNSFAKELVSKLRPGGILFIETGNLADLASREEFSDRLFLPDHLVFAGVGQMTEEITRLGLKVERTNFLPIDSISWCLKAFVKNILYLRKLHIPIPGKSRFRTVLYKAVYA